MGKNYNKKKEFYSVMTVYFNNYKSCINNFSINSQGFKLKLIVQGERKNVKNIYLIMGYQASFAQLIQKVHMLHLNQEFI